MMLDFSKPKLFVERFEIRPKQPNPLIEHWLKKWLQEAEAANCATQHKLREALESIRRYPLVLASGAECSLLNGFDDQLCHQIDREIKLHQQQQPKGTANWLTQLSAAKQAQAAAKQTQSTATDATKSKPKALAKSKSAPVIKPAKPPKLTKAAQKALEAEEARLRQVSMPAGSFNILMLVDTQETSGKWKRSFDQTRTYIETLDIPYEVRRLTIGDFLWIARDAAGNELVLPYIVERKRMDDLATSIRDGRFHEQKFRLKNSKLQHIIYLIEDHGNNEHIGLPLENLLQGIVNAQVQSGVMVRHVENHWRAMAYLKTLTSALSNMFKGKQLVSTTKAEIKPYQPQDNIVGLLKFREVYDDSARNAQLTVREVFVQQLLQLHSLSFDKALAIVELYPTPRCLLDAYEKCETEQQARELLASLRCGKLERPLGVKISKALYDFYRTIF